LFYKHLGNHLNFRWAILSFLFSPFSVAKFYRILFIDLKDANNFFLNLTLHWHCLKISTINLAKIKKNIDLFFMSKTESISWSDFCFMWKKNLAWWNPLPLKKVKLSVTYVAKSIATCKKKSLYNQPKPYFFKKLLWSHFWIDFNKLYTKTFRIVYILIVYLLIMFIWVVFICTKFKQDC
jgi:hypothetical protein